MTENQIKDIFCQRRHRECKLVRHRGKERERQKESERSRNRERGRANKRRHQLVSARDQAK